MPSGKVHLRIEMVILAGCLALGSYLVKEELIEAVHLTVFFGAYLFSSFFLTPDLDLKQSLAFRRWGIARVLWVPYARLFRHRALSHSILLGPLTRILYLGFILFVITIAAANMAGRCRSIYPNGGSSFLSSPAFTCQITSTSSLMFSGLSPIIAKVL